MRFHSHIWGLFLSQSFSFLYLLILEPTALAQIVQDATLPTPSIVIQDGNINIINGGTKAGSNLFHSFEEFSLPTGTTAYFNNGTNIQNIISRVTGKSISNIDGLIQANGTANLLLINPNGITFGQNARLDIGGSFLASTASSLKFANNFEFSATNPKSTPLLAINTPIGLQFGRNTGTIRMQGEGHKLIGPAFSPIILSNNSGGLQVQPGKTLAIIGGDVSLESGIIGAKGGRIELGSVSDNSLVSINPTVSGWELGYEGVPSFQDVRFTGRSLADVSGTGNGSIQIQGSRITLTDGSVILNQNQGLLPAGSIKINASESLEIVSGTNPGARVASGLRSETLGFGKAGDIVISSKQIILRNGSQINALTFGDALGGNIFIDASDSVQILGASPLTPQLLSTIGAGAFSSGKVGNITLSASKLVVRDGGALTSSNFGSGQGGDVFLNIRDYIEVIGYAPIIFQPSIISTTTFNSGNAGDLILNTSILKVQDGGRVDASTLASGNSGSITINASDSVVVSGINSQNPSLLISSADIVAKNLQDLYKLPPVPSGDSGSITINTPSLSISNGAQVTVRNSGPGNAGTLQINADKISITSNGGITATTAVGEGGNIDITSKIIQLRSGSISTTAGIQGGTGNGGNIDIFTDVLTASGNSAITANAYEGRGGSIQINTRGYFISPNTRVEATSEKGIDGTVEINFQQGNPTQVKAQPSAIAQDPQIASACQGSNQGEISFVNFGTERLADSSDEQVDDNSIWKRNSPVQAIENLEQLSLPVKQEPTKIVEAQGWVVNAKGEIVLIADNDAGTPYASLPSTCQVQPSTTQVSSQVQTGRN